MRELMEGLKEFGKRLLATEPIRVAAFVESLLAVLAMFNGLIDPEQAAAISALLISTHELARRLVYSPATHRREIEEAVEAALSEAA